MAIRKILTAPNPILRQKSKPVGKIDKKVKKLVADLIETVKTTKEPKGVGIAAVQVGKLVRIFVIKQGKKFVPFINPEIVWQSKRMISQAMEKNKLLLEGCLSVPGYYGFVDRPYAVKFKWLDLKGQTQQKKFVGKEAIYVQNELDHLDGILFVDRILEQKGKIYKLEK